MKKIRILSLVLAVMLLGVLGIAEPTAAPEQAIPAEVGKLAPDFELELLNGETFKLSEQRGKVVFLNIWATWCGPCVMEMPDIEALSKAYPDDLVVIGVSCDESAEEVQAFLAENQYTYHFAMDQNYQISGLLYPSYGIPNSIFIDPNGVITSMEMGSASYEEMERRYLEAKGENAQAEA